MIQMNKDILKENLQMIMKMIFQIYVVKEQMVVKKKIMIKNA